MGAGANASYSAAIRTYSSDDETAGDMDGGRDDGRSDVPMATPVTDKVVLHRGHDTRLVPNDEEVVTCTADSERASERVRGWSDNAMCMCMCMCMAVRPEGRGGDSFVRGMPDGSWDRHRARHWTRPKWTVRCLRRPSQCWTWPQWCRACRPPAAYAVCSSTTPEQWQSTRPLTPPPATQLSERSSSLHNAQDKRTQQNKQTISR
jgi:hypothetical protein